ncbi:MAG: ABC transporter ATP-binding protein [Lachnospiraceae bacterium]|nr:ABC transporter ATP-binding protein [Lachnospiraceae bacterium]
MIKVTNLCKIYGKNVALDHVSFEVEQGHIYGLLGPNGAGKSTTMNIITGYIAPTEGEVSVNGHILGKDTLAAKKCIGYLPEIPPLYPDMIVKEYLTFVAGLKKVAKADREQEVLSAIEKTGLKDVEKRMIRNLSKGYKQRVGIAQAILGGPDIIILDEPTVGLDPQQIIEIRELIRSLKESHTVILSSHILSEIAEVCDDVLMIAHGKVVAMDTTENLMKHTGDGVREFRITVKGEQEKISEVLNGLTAIVLSSEFVSEDDGKCTFNFTTERVEDIREDVSFALSDRRLLVLDMSEKKSSLEETYLKLMKDSDEKYEEELRLAALAEEDEEDEEDEKNGLDDVEFLVTDEDEEETSDENDSDDDTESEPEENMEEINETPEDAREEE